ncbi:MAG: sialidase family protein, partial [Bacteroidia bacterium]|nr:sialidase family protein [Bacteroidia bacterium]
MKKTVSYLGDFRKIFSILFVLFLFSFEGYSNNPKISNFLTNLSSQVNLEALDDVYPEIVISGNTLHVVWIEYKYGVENSLYYCRSIDLGKTWEVPRIVARLKDNSYALQPQTRKLAVDGSNVHIGFCDYDYYGGGTGRIYYVRSTDGGTSFDPAREIVTTGGGYARIFGSHIKAVNGKVAVAYQGSGAKNGLRMLSSVDGGTTFTDKLITEEPSGFTDLWFDGNQMIVVSEYAYYYYGLNVGKVFVSVSNDNAATFVTNKISSTFIWTDGLVYEKCRCYNDVHYAPKIAKFGNNIHVVFAGYNETAEWTTLYARSVDNGQTFEKARDINNAILPAGALQAGQETVTAKNGHVYLAYLSNAGKVFFLQSADNGNSFSTAKNILPEGYDYVQTTWWPSLVTDPNDETGSTVYLTGNWMFSARSEDGGATFSHISIGEPFLNRNISNSMADMAIDSHGTNHWISEAKWWAGSDRDIFYRAIGSQPEPGTTNKSLSIETVWAGKQELVIVPSSASLDLDSAMTAETWVKLDPSTVNWV